jgi:hypothetical protein
MWMRKREFDTLVAQHAALAADIFDSEIMSAVGGTLCRYLAACFRLSLPLLAACLPFMLETFFTLYLRSFIPE